MVARQGRVPNSNFECYETFFFSHVSGSKIQWEKLIEWRFLVKRFLSKWRRRGRESFGVFGCTQSVDKNKWTFLMDLVSTVLLNG